MKVCVWDCVCVCVCGGDCVCVSRGVQMILNILNIKLGKCD